MHNTIFNLSYSTTLQNQDLKNYIFNNNKFSTKNAIEILSSIQQQEIKKISTAQSTDSAIQKIKTESNSKSFDFANITQDQRSLITAKEKETLISKIRYSYFESGIWTPADEYFDTLAKKYCNIEFPLTLLSDIANRNLKNEHILEGVLHILSNYSYEEISPFGITIAIACTVNHSPIIQDLLISCFEKWDSPDSIEILSGLKLSTPWLIKYQQEVLLQLTNKA